jgi:predicted RecA/RadA family phage recombinase
MGQAAYIQQGGSIDYTPGSAVPEGEVVVFGNIIGVARAPIAANELGSLAIDGVFEFPKASGSSTAIAAGTLVYWDDTNNVITTTASSHKKIGPTIAASVDADTKQRVLLQPLG